MPFVTQDKADAMRSRPPETAGELGYVIGCAINDFVSHRKVEMGELRFQILSEVMGTLDTIARNFWDEVGAPYEAKVKQNSPFRWR